MIGVLNKAIIVLHRELHVVEFVPRSSLLDLTKKNVVVETKLVWVQGYKGVFSLSFHAICRSPHMCT